MRRSQRLGTVLDVVADVERKSATALADAEARAGEAERKLAELERYEREYRESLQAKSSAGIAAAQLRAFHGFITRLGEAVAQQRGIVLRLRDECATLRERWVEAGRRARSVGKAVENADAQERRALELREQQACDERAQRSFAARAGTMHEEPARRAPPNEDT